MILRKVHFVRIYMTQTIVSTQEKKNKHVIYLVRFLVSEWMRRFVQIEV